MIRSKLKVTNIRVDRDINGVQHGEEITLEAVYSADKTSENYQWSLWTPSATFKLYVTNPDCFGKLELNKEYFNDLRPV